MVNNMESHVMSPLKGALLPFEFFFLGSCSPAFLTKNLGKNNFVLIGLDLFSVLYCISDFIGNSLILHLVRLKKCLPMARNSCNMLRYMK